MKRYQWAILFGTIYLVMYVSLFQLGASQAWLEALFTLSPAVVIWMAYDILRHAHYNGRQLGEGEEFGYGDKRTEELGLF